MTQQAVVEPTTTALVERLPEDRLTALAGTEIRTPNEFAMRVRELQGHAHVLSPMSAVGAIAPSHVINTMVVVIDPSVDAESGRGADVYFQRAIHKSRKISSGGDGERAQYAPLEVSLNKIGLQKMLQASGANVYPTERLDDGREKNLWIMRTQADILTFDGRIVRLPAGTASVDLRDGSADIGEWTPAAWAESVEVAQRGLKPSELWKAKPRAINGWTGERVMSARKFGMRLAEAKSLNALARNLGVRQTYTIGELAKPFVIFRASYVPDVSDPAVRQMLTAASLGARSMLYGGAAPEQHIVTADAPVSHTFGEVGETVEASVVEPSEPESAERMVTAHPPEDAREIDIAQTSSAATPTSSAEPLYLPMKLMKQGDGDTARYFVETDQNVTLYTTDVAIVRACATAKKEGRALAIVTERVVVAGKPYRQIVELTSADPKL